MTRIIAAVLLLGLLSACGNVRLGDARGDTWVPPNTGGGGNAARGVPAGFTAAALTPFAAAG